MRRRNLLHSGKNSGPLGIPIQSKFLILLKTLSGRRVNFKMLLFFPQKVARQCLEGLKFLHRLGIIHCDIKPENILIKSYRRCKIKIIDLGSSCFRADNLGFYVQSRSYRAPEVIVGLPYDEKIDIWSLGCVLAELYSGEARHFQSINLVAH